MFQYYIYIYSQSITKQANKVKFIQYIKAKLVRIPENFLCISLGHISCFLPSQYGFSCDWSHRASSNAMILKSILIVKKNGFTPVFLTVIDSFTNQQIPKYQDLRTMKCLSLLFIFFRLTSKAFLSLDLVVFSHHFCGEESTASY